MSTSTTPFPEPGGLPLVLLPGMGCSPDLWADLELDAEPVTPVLSEPDLDAEVDRLLGLLPERFALAGLSLGAIVAMALVRRAPQRVSRLCLMSTNPYGPTREQRAGWTEQRGTLAATSARGLQAHLLPLLVQRPDLEPRVLAMAEQVGEARYDAQLRLQATRLDERPGLGRVSCPTLVLAARNDRLCPVARHEEIARLVPGARLVVVEDCAHLSPLERPAAVGSHLRGWHRNARD